MLRMLLRFPKGIFDGAHHSVAELFMTQEDLEKYRINFSSPKQEELPTVTRSEIIFLAEKIIQRLK